MSIDWVTVLAQLANFLLLVWLLRRFLYRPILDGIDAREADIAARMATADEARAEAEAAEQRYLEQLGQTVAARDSMLAEAMRATKDERDQLLAEARVQRVQEQQDWQRQLTQERQDFLERLQRNRALTLLQLTRKAMHELADQPLEAAIARQLARRLEPMAAELAAAVGASRQVTVSTHEPLADEVRRDLQDELRAMLPGVEPQFVVDAEQSPGVVLQSGGARVAWTINSYMDEFDRSLGDDDASGMLATGQVDAR